MRRWRLGTWILGGASSIAACGPLAGPSTQACETIAADQRRCGAIAERNIIGNRNECQRQIELGTEGCPEAYEALARCLPTVSCVAQQTLTSACTELAGDVAARCAPTVQAANSNTINTRGTVNLH